jgi:hypothetical protein
VNEEDRRLSDRFFDMMSAEFGASRHTLGAYRNDLERAAETLGSPLATAGPDQLSTLAERWGDLSAATVARRSAALRRFYGFLIDEGLRSDDPSAALPRPRLERPLPRILDEGEVSRIFTAAEQRARGPASGRECRGLSFRALLSFSCQKDGSDPRSDDRCVRRGLGCTVRAASAESRRPAGSLDAARGCLCDRIRCTETRSDDRRKLGRSYSARDIDRRAELPPAVLWRGTRVGDGAGCDWKTRASAF